MVVWLRYGQGAVGITEGVIRAADFANLVSTEEALFNLTERARGLFDTTQKTCDEMLSSSEARVAAVMAEAQAIKQAATAEGLQIGRTEALNAWAQRTVNQAIESRAMLERQKLRLRDIVSLCVERLVGDGDRKALFARALKTISKLVQDVPMLTLRVHESDVAAAQMAVDELLAPGGSKFPIEVVVDITLPPGGCLFESDLGVIDAGLENQLQAIRRAVAKATQQVASTAQRAEELSGDPELGEDTWSALNECDVATVDVAAAPAQREPAEPLQ
jgi:type III secretion protein L